MFDGHFKEDVESFENYLIIPSITINIALYHEGIKTIALCYLN